ncbi:hypothetical protein FB107DRAFT_273673 [Schizophyllum commune]
MPTRGKATGDWYEREFLKLYSVDALRPTSWMFGPPELWMVHLPGACVRLAPFHLPYIRHRQAAHDADADADGLASAVNALPGSPNATITGQPNGLVVVKKAPGSQWLASVRNISRESPMPLHTGSSMTTSTSSSRPRDASQVHQCLYVERAQYHGDRAPQWYATRYASLQVFEKCPLGLMMRIESINVLSSAPNAIAPGSSWHYILDLAMRRKCINISSGLFEQPHEHLKIKLLDLLQLKMIRKSVNASGSSPNAAHTGSSMTPSTTSF